MLFNVTVDSIVKQFVKMQEQLDSLIKNKTETINSNDRVVVRLGEETKLHLAEIKRARAIQNNINNIFNV